MGITRDQLTGIKHLRVAGLSVRAIAPVVGLSPTTVLKFTHLLTDQDDRTALVWKVQGLDGKSRLTRRINTAERDASIVRLRSEGRSMRDIAGTVECSVGTVHRVLKASPSVQ